MLVRGLREYNATSLAWPDPTWGLATLARLQCYREAVQEKGFPLVLF